MSNVVDPSWRHWRRPSRGVRRNFARRLAFERFEDRRQLTVFTVTSLADAPVDSAGDAPGTLRQAVFDANQNNNADTIVFAAALDGEVALSHVGDSSLGPSALNITTPITIDGNAAGVAITRGQFAPVMRLFHVGAGGNLTLKSLTVTGGFAQAAAGELGHGGAVLVTPGSELRIVSSTFYENFARGGSGANARGGAIYALNGSIVTISNSTFSGNLVQNSAGATAGFGAGIYSLNGSVFVYNSTFAESAVIPGRSIYVIADGAEATAEFRIYNSIAAAGGGQSDILATFDNGGSITVNGSHNIVLIGLAPLSNLGAVSIDPQLGPLADNGGPTMTHAFLLNIENHPAIDQGDPNFNPNDPDGNPLTSDAMPFDQRGNTFARVQDGNGISGPRLDIGAFELQVELPAPELPGDYNGDHFVNAADYTVWRNTLGMPVVRWSGADGDGSQTIDFGDYIVWKQQYGQSQGAAASSGAAATLITADITPQPAASSHDSSPSIGATPSNSAPLIAAKSLTYTQVESSSRPPRIPFTTTSSIARPSIRSTPDDHGVSTRSTADQSSDDSLLLASCRVTADEDVSRPSVSGGPRAAAADNANSEAVGDRTLATSLSASTWEQLWAGFTADALK